MHSTFPIWVAALVASAPAWAGAESAAATEPPPGLTYRSAFAEYPAYVPPPPADWRALNDALVPGAQPAAPTAHQHHAMPPVPTPAAESGAPPMPPHHHHSHGGLQ